MNWSVTVKTDKPRILHIMHISFPFSKSSNSHIIKNVYSLLSMFKKCVRVSAYAQSFKLHTFMYIRFYTLMCSAIIIHLHASYRFLSFCILFKHLAFSFPPYIVILTTYSIA